MSIVLLWFAQTSIMPLAVGAATGALAQFAWGGQCPASAMRRAIWSALASWLVHLACVGSGLIREGSIWDYAVVLLACVAATAWVCRGARRATAR